VFVFDPPAAAVRGNRAVDFGDGIGVTHDGPRSADMARARCGIRCGFRVSRCDSNITPPHTNCQCIRGLFQDSFEEKCATIDAVVGIEFELHCGRAVS
jgi:hypothetical protein